MQYIIRTASDRAELVSTQDFKFARRLLSFFLASGIGVIMDMRQPARVARKAA